MVYIPSVGENVRLTNGNVAIITGKIQTPNTPIPGAPTIPEMFIGLVRESNGEWGAMTRGLDGRRFFDGGNHPYNIEEQIPQGRGTATIIVPASATPGDVLMSDTSGVQWEVRVKVP